uniref:Zinc transporter ZIP3 n=1 Tax=Jaculus jaculus TaxID=51337 RepID=A0A8C5KJ46_JACJA|nr:zinc transporter ZIP3 [Jaculus jaculus]XP_044990984.1 zinc transporter ZIP3 [Jaculus jaculus]XP_044990985.1 zinc transporter ZIP3 [Jaculus jaculus]
MTRLLVAKILCMVGVFFFMLLGSLLPVKVIHTDFEKAHRSRKILSLCNTFGGGVFLATCFNALLPAVRDKLQQVLSLGHISTDYPLAETLMLLGFFITVFVEQLVLTFRKEKPSFIDLDTFNAGSDAGSDSEYESPFVGVGMGGARGHSLYPEPITHTHSAGLRLQELARPGPLRLLSLVFALSAHSVFEGLALGLQEEGERVVSLFVGVAVHETLVAVALGISMARSAMPLRDAAKLAVTVSAMIPLGIGLGLGIESARGVPSSVASVLLQGLAGGTFLFVTFLEILAKELEDKSDRLLKVLFLVLGYAVLAGMVFLKW